MARGHHPGSGPGTGRACLSPPVDCRDGRIVACTAGSGPDADARRQDARQGRGDAAGGGASPGAFRPRMATAGDPDDWRSWTATAWHGRRAPRAVPRTTPPRRGFLGRMKTESVHPEHWEERTRSEALVPVDDCIRWHDHEHIRRPLGWMSPVRYRQSQGMAA